MAELFCLCHYQVMCAGIVVFEIVPSTLLMVRNIALSTFDTITRFD